MSTKFLHREDSPFEEEIWDRIDETVIEAAKSQLSARQLLHVEGPYGLGLKSITSSDMNQKESERANISVSEILPLAEIHQDFSLPIRDIANYERFNKPLNLKTAAQAAIACAKQEDSFLYYGSKPRGIDGLLNSEGTQSIELQPWDEVGTAVNDIIQAITKLDDAGFHGPYTLGLAPQRFNLLFRRYPRGNMTEMDHLKSIITKKTVKAPSISSGGVVLSYGGQYASIVLGQDLMTGFIGPSGAEYEFIVFESLTLRLLQPAAVCILK
ncbi:DUF2184 domain-containing protein [Candidatus Bathyarchaeota archaeon]|nr:bacteriocin family protein [Candidatus Bathyarchaeota archaeon]NIR17434.1 bacteriocin family protein [Desulfobacterales bacterium]NIU81575.1 DUF2184 domain-containing protein [Candidatus Bathyarchaeota archaeon]NIV68217.1 DUF2184 domain-containing protein [Candidatus Bathyarchaeota archaeon]NIW16473.1 DUF2184 domain-containing protein [Candidatus Bathyarchaeota archaeon]